MTPLLMLITGVLLGGAAVSAVAFFREKSLRALFAIKEEMWATREEERKASEAERLTHMKEAFESLSSEALKKNVESFLTLANENFTKNSQVSAKEMAGKKDMIDQTLKTMKGELDKVQTLMQTIEKDRKAKFEVLSNEITKTASETRKLRETTHTLNAALTNSRVRGQWGERMAEDVLRLSGLIEGTNYLKQKAVEGDASSRPDYTFYLPDERVVHMDVKFPIENYILYLEAEGEADKKRHLNQFMKDARDRIKEVTKRGYMNETTLDYVLVFIPNEQLYAFINEQDRTLLDDAMKHKIILCSPTTLYAVLAVIRQAVDNFHMERKASEILGLLGTFQKQWEKFIDAMDKVGRGLDSTQRAFQELTTTRVRQLQKPLDQIDALKTDDTRQIETGTGRPLKVIEALDTPDEASH